MSDLWETLEPALLRGRDGELGARFRSPMSVAVTGGRITSTVLSLQVVPAVFTCIDNLEYWF